MIDNFYKFQDTQLSVGEFLFIQILQRSKENPHIGSKNKLIKYYCIEDSQQLVQIKNEIVTLCESMNARAYIHYTPRSWIIVHKEMIVKLIKRFANNNYDRGLRNIFSSACGSCYLSSKKTWLIDIDDVDEVPQPLVYCLYETTPKGQKIIDQLGHLTK